MSSEIDDQAGDRGISYINLCSGNNFVGCKRKTEVLTIQQGFIRHLKNNIKACSANYLGTVWLKFEGEIDVDKNNWLKIAYLKNKSERKFNASV